jgi:hypothetical protein
MILIIGLVVLLVAVAVGFTGVLTNTGPAHPLTENFDVVGYHVTGSTGTLFLGGIVVGAVAMLGLSVLLAGARRTAGRGRDARRELDSYRVPRLGRWWHGRQPRARAMNTQNEGSLPADTMVTAANNEPPRSRPRGTWSDETAASAEPHRHKPTSLHPQPVGTNWATSTAVRQRRPLNSSTTQWDRADTMEPASQTPQTRRTADRKEPEDH